MDSDEQKVLGLLEQIGSVYNYHGIARRLLSCLQDCIPFDQNSMLFRDSEQGFFTYVDAYGDQQYQRWIAAYNERYSRIAPISRCVTSEGGTRIAEWKDSDATEYYQDFLRPQRIRHTLSFLLPGWGKEPAAVIMLTRSRSDRAFTDRDRRRAELLFPHLKQLHVFRCMMKLLEIRVISPLEISQNASLLSPRESEVVAMVCGRMTNREIAASLGVSVRTVDTHLVHVYQKLGLGSRKELVHRFIAPYVADEASIGKPPRNTDVAPWRDATARGQSVMRADIGAARRTSPYCTRS